MQKLEVFVHTFAMSCYKFPSNMLNAVWFNEQKSADDSSGGTLFLFFIFTEGWFEERPFSVSIIS